MDTCFPDWNNLTGLDSPLPGQKKPFTSDNDLVELLWQNGELVMQTQNNKNPSFASPSNPPQQLHHGQDQQPSESPILNDETVSWADFPIDVCFDKEFCSSFLPQIQPPGPARVDCGVPTPRPPPRFEPSDARISTSSGRNLQKIPIERNSRKEGREQTIMTVGSSHCASNQVITNDVDMSWASSSNLYSRTLDETSARSMRAGHEVAEGGANLERANTSSSNGSGSSFCKTNDRSSDEDTNRLKRKKKDMEESEQRSEATELESAAINKSSQKSGSARKTRVAQVHNLSERRRRDRINEKMKALQELIPHSTKSDKASMLDEAIEYMKALQLQLQFLWMGGGMAPMMLPGVGLVGPQTLPAMQNLMRLSQLPLVNQALTTMSQAQMIQSQAQMLRYQNRMQNSGFPEQHGAAAPNCMGFHGFQNSNQQPMNVFNLGSLMAQQQNHTPAAPPGPGNGDGSI